MNETQRTNPILYIILIIATLSLLVGTIGLFTGRSPSPVLEPQSNSVIRQPGGMSATPTPTLGDSTGTSRTQSDGAPSSR